MSGFGRKGLAPGQNAAPPTGFGRAGGGASTSPSGSASSPDQSAQLQAFLAEERQRRASVSGGALGGGIDDYGASHYHGQANYHGQNTNTRGGERPKTKTVAYLLWFFLGGYGAHRLYLGAYISGAFLAITGLFRAYAMYATMTDATYHLSAFDNLLMVIAGVWMIIDAFLIPGMVRRHNQRLG